MIEQEAARSMRVSQAQGLILNPLESRLPLLDQTIQVWKMEEAGLLVGPPNVDKRTRPAIRIDLLNFVAESLES